MERMDDGPKRETTAHPTPSSCVSSINRYDFDVDLHIAYPPDPTANQLLRRLLDSHPRLANLGPRADDIRRVIQTSGTIVDALGTLRNRATLAHPNEELIGHDEALLVINVTRSLLRFLDSKLARQ